MDVPVELFGLVEPVGLPVVVELFSVVHSLAMEETVNGAAGGGGERDRVSDDAVPFLEGFVDGWL